MQRVHEKYHRHSLSLPEALQHHLKQRADGRTTVYSDEHYAAIVHHLASHVKQDTVDGSPQIVVTSKCGCESKVVAMCKSRAFCLRPDIEKGRVFQPTVPGLPSALPASHFEMLPRASEINAIVSQLHDANHDGLEKTFQAIRAKRWLNISKTLVKSYVDNCAICRNTEPKGPKNEAPMKPILENGLHQRWVVRPLSPLSACLTRRAD